MKAMELGAKIQRRRFGMNEKKEEPSDGEASESRRSELPQSDK
jgi:hypothetical protein